MAPSSPPSVRSATLALGRGRIRVRERGEGRVLVVLHGGPDFDHRYLLPEIDRLSDGYRLVLYDQRGRGGSYTGERPEDVTLASEAADLEAVRAWTGADRLALVGHSFGAVLASAFAIRHPDRVSHLVLLCPAPLSRMGRRELIAGISRVRTPDEIERMAAIRASDGWASGDIEVERSWYRLHFRPAVHRPEALDDLLPRFRDGWTPEQVVAARAIEDGLYAQTWERDDFDLVPELARTGLPLLVIHGDHDLVPPAIGRRIADMVPGSRFQVIPECGHFPYLEQPSALRRLLDAFLGSARGDGT